MRKLETFGGNHIRDVLQRALHLAASGHETVSFDFNGKTYIVEPTDTYETAKARAETVGGFPILTAEEDAARAKDELERVGRESAAAIATAGVPTERQLREADVPSLETPEELNAYIAALVDRPHDYGTCCYAMSMAAVAAFNYVARRLGVTGFQASCADLDVLRRTRSLKGPFLIVKAEDALYPQYDLRGRLDDALREWRPWLSEEASKLLAERGPVSPSVRRHWSELAGRPR